MTIIRNILVSVALLAMSSMAVAQSADDVCNFNNRGLTTQQQTELTRQCQEMIKPSVAEELLRDSSNWGQLAQDFAGAIGIAAREVGMATNEFLQTPAGLLVVLLLIWNFTSIPSFILGMIIYLPMVYIVSRVVTHFLMTIWYQKRETTQVPTLWGLFNRTKVSYSERIRDWSEGEGYISLLLVAFLLAAVLVGAAIIF